jgi:fumarate reductase subunit D
LEAGIVTLKLPFAFVQSDDLHSKVFELVGEVINLVVLVLLVYYCVVFVHYFSAILLHAVHLLSDDSEKLDLVQLHAFEDEVVHHLHYFVDFLVVFD